MFDATIGAPALQSMMRALSAVVSEAAFIIDKDGISVNAVDPSNAAMAAITISESAFIEYSATEAEIGIDLARFMEILGMSAKDGNISLSIDEETHKLSIDMSNLTYTMGLLDVSTLRKSPSVPELNLPAEITMPASKFKQAIKASGMVADAMKIGIDGKTVYMEARGDSDNVLLELSGNDIISLKDAAVSGTYSLDYLNDMVKGIGATPEITINLGRDLPMVIDFTPYPRCDVTYLLAPRINPEG